MGTQILLRKHTKPFNLQQSKVERFCMFTLKMRIYILKLISEYLIAIITSFLFILLMYILQLFNFYLFLIITSFIVFSRNIKYLYLNDCCSINHIFRQGLLGKMRRVFFYDLYKNFSLMLDIFN